MEDPDLSLVTGAWKASTVEFVAVRFSRNLACCVGRFYMCACVCICMNVHVLVSAHVLVCMRTCMCRCMPVCVCVYNYVSTRNCVRLFTLHIQAPASFGVPQQLRLDAQYRGRCLGLAPQYRGPSRMSLSAAARLRSVATCRGIYASHGANLSTLYHSGRAARGADCGHLPA